MGAKLKEEYANKYLAMTPKERRDELSRLKLQYFDLSVNSTNEHFKSRGINLGLTRSLTFLHINFLKPIVKEENLIEQVRLKKLSDERFKEFSEFFVEYAKESIDEKLFKEITNKAWDALKEECRLISKDNQT